MKSFAEVQRFNQWWLWVIIVVPSLLPVYIGLFQLAKGKTNSLAMEILLGVIVSTCLILLMRSFRLTTTIDQQGIGYQFYPLHRQPIHKNWNEINEAFVRTYDTWKEYGGLGLRYSSKNGEALNISGNTGLQLVFKNGKKLLLGTQQGLVVAEVLKNLQPGN